MIPEEAVFARTAAGFGMAPWALEAALADDPRAFRWYLMADPLGEYEAAVSAAGGRPRA